MPKFGIPPAPTVPLQIGNAVNPVWYVFFESIFQTVGAGQAPITLGQLITAFVNQRLALTAPNWLVVAGSPVGGNTGILGSLAITSANETQNKFLASPSGATGALTPRLIVGADLPTPTASTLGGVESIAAVAHEFLTSLTLAGQFVAAQPAFTDILGVAAQAQIPALSSLLTNQTFDLTTATGAVQTFSVPFTPSTVDGHGSVNGTTALAYTTFHGAVDAAGNTGCTYAGGGSYNTGASFFVAMDATGANSQTAVVTYGTNQVIVTWTKAGTPTGTFSYSLRCFK